MYRKRCRLAAGGWPDELRGGASEVGGATCQAPFSWLEGWCSSGNRALPRFGVATEAATLQSGGWDLQAARAPVSPLPQPTSLAATGGDLDGTMDLTWDAIRRVVQTYVAERALSPSGPGTQCYVGKPSKWAVTGLTSRTEYWFRLRAIGAAGPSPWSAPATKRAT
jgi:hypothetical protein